ncbi:MAG: cullin 3B [Faunusvirus sp.]|jgi:hypothetical protein|uniref:Cullin 3B n=1 Tax=Faunusvirus sp. TaxID=2487766 RepID=A0A3G4ZXK3_9VIRU|nr:MAG: cullin 3B [Faunusvirus sp.]
MASLALSRQPIIDKFQIVKGVKNSAAIIQDINKYISDIFIDKQVLNKSAIINEIYHLLNTDSKQNTLADVSKIIADSIKSYLATNRFEITKYTAKQFYVYWKNYLHKLKQVNEIFKYINFNSSNYSIKYVYFVGYTAFADIYINNRSSAFIKNLCDAVIRLDIENLQYVIDLMYIIYKYDDEKYIVHTWAVEDKIVQSIFDNVQATYTNKENIVTLVKKWEYINKVLGYGVNHDAKKYEHSGLPITLKNKLYNLLYASLSYNITLLISSDVTQVDKLMVNEYKFIKSIYMYIKTKKQNEKTLTIDKFILPFANYISQFKSIKYEESNFVDMSLLYNIIDTVDKITDIRILFDNGAKVAEYVNTVCKTILNSETKLIEYITQCVPKLFKIRSAKNNDMINNNITSVLNMTKWFNDVDIFILTYEKYLADRLLNYLSVYSRTIKKSSKSVNEKNKQFITKMAEDETMFVKYIGILHGDHIVLHMTHMLTNFTDNIDMIDEFNNINFKDDSKTFNAKLLNFTILTSQYWKFIDTVNKNNYACQLPDEINIYLQTLKKYYTMRHDRSINLLMDSSEATVNFTNRSGKYSVKCTLPQLSIMMLFKSSIDIISHDTIKKNTTLPDSVLRQLLLSLIDAKILKIMGINDDIAMYHISDEPLESTDHVIDITRYAVKAEESKVKLAELLKDDRENIVMCSIVATMKKAKKMSRINLYDAVIKYSSRFFALEKDLFDGQLNKAISTDEVIIKDNFVEYIE